MSIATRGTPAFPLGYTLDPPQRNSWQLLSACWHLFCCWAERHRQRRALAELASAPHLLTDLGLTRTHALREADKPFWRA